VPAAFAIASTSSSGWESYGDTTSATPISTARRCASARLPTTTMSFGPIVLPIVATSTVTAHSRPLRRRVGGTTIVPPSTSTIRSADAGRSAKLDGSLDSLM
jgi:hypothetical protein